MKRIFGYLIGVMLVALPTVVSSCSTSRSAAGKTSTEDSIANIVGRKLIEGKAFLLSGERASVGSSPMMTVTPSTNFLTVEGSVATLQISPRITGGPNGVGGFTFSGEISDYEVSVSKKGNVSVRFRVAANGGSAEISVSMYPDCNRASAMITATFHRGRAQLEGLILPLGSSSVIEGRTF